MGSRSKIQSDSSDSRLEEEIFEKPKKTVSEPKLVTIQSFIDTRYIIFGKVTGKRYVFDGAGSEVKVDERDADQILGMKRGKPCCGGTGGTPIFKVVGG